MNICFCDIWCYMFFQCFVSDRYIFVRDKTLEKEIKRLCSFTKFFFFFENVSFVFFFIEIDLVFVFRSFYVISPTTDSYIFRILLLSTAERVAWMSLILPCSYESSRQIFLAAAADQSGGTLITGVLPRPWDWFPARVPVRGRHRAVLVVCRARVCIVYFF